MTNHSFDADNWPIIRLTLTTEFDWCWSLTNHSFDVVDDEPLLLLLLVSSSSPVSGFSGCCDDDGVDDVDCWFSLLLIWLLGCIGCGELWLTLVWLFCTCCWDDGAAPCCGGCCCCCCCWELPPLTVGTWVVVGCGCWVG